MRHLTVMLLMMWGTGALGWGPATHVYLAEQTTGLSEPEVHFGAMLADMNQMIVSDPLVFDAMRHLVHYEFHRITPSCLALGFATHNEEWGADAYAHEYFLADDPEFADLYATQKIRHLSEHFVIPMVEAEFLLEFGLDYLLRLDEGPVVGRKLRAAAASFGVRQQQLIVNAFAPPLEEMLPALTRVQAEKQVRTASRRYRDVTKLYGGVLMQNEDAVFRALAKLASFYLGYPRDVAEVRLEYAVELCRDDYRAELDRIGELLRADMQIYAPEAMAACPGGCTGPRGTAPASCDPILAAFLVSGLIRAARRALLPDAGK